MPYRTLQIRIGGIANRQAGVKRKTPAAGLKGVQPGRGLVGLLLHPFATRYWLSQLWFYWPAMDDRAADGLDAKVNPRAVARVF